MKKKFIAKLLALCLVLSMVPVTAFAANIAGSNDGASNGGASNGGASNGGASNGGGHYFPDTTPVVNVIDVDDVTIEGNTATIKVTVVNGKATLTLSDAVLETLAEQFTGEELVLKVEATGANKTELSVSAKALTGFAKKTGAALTVELGDVATISIPNTALVSAFGETGTVKISAQADGSYSVQLDGKALEIEGIKATF